MAEEKKIVLPKDIEAEDLKYPAYEADDEQNRIVATFEMWYTEGLGWVIDSDRRGLQSGSRSTRLSEAYGVRQSVAQSSLAEISGPTAEGSAAVK